jgi:hypothetical protein
VNIVYFGSGVLDLTLSSQIALVPNKQLINTFTRISVDLLEPGLHIGE